jgi:transketolase C-terminal domain/subunit
VLYIPSIKPVNTQQIVFACESVPLIFTVEEPTVLGGLATMVGETIPQDALAHKLLSRSRAR